MSGFDPERWLDVADACCQSATGQNEEAFLRTALNRAYYAVLLTIKRRLEGALGPGSVRRAGTHTALLEALRSGGPPFDHIHGRLQKLRRSRELADYELASGAPPRHLVRSRVRLSKALIRKEIAGLPDAAFRSLTLPK
ncbi:MAG TPA: HEPN domain-containing protein [Longimicrobiaceae bacterium]|nr:HEPN domain-containing protein [Longimicrobiaceae bacterium]